MIPRYPGHEAAAAGLPVVLRRARPILRKSHCTPKMLAEIAAASRAPGSSARIWAAWRWTRTWSAM